MFRRSLNLFLACLVLALAVAPVSGPALAKEYNQRQHLAPGQRAKVDRTIAKSRHMNTQQGPTGGAPGDVTNTGCGQLEIGSIQADPRSRRRQRDNIVVVTGDVINVAQGCRNRR